MASFPEPVVRGLRRAALALTSGLLIFAAGCGGGSSSSSSTSTTADVTIPAGDVAAVQGVDNGVITQDQLKAAVNQQARSVVAPGHRLSPADPEWDTVLTKAMHQLLLPIWVAGEGAERGITPTDEQVSTELQSEIQKHGPPQVFLRSVKESGLCTKDELQAAGSQDPLDEALSCVGVQRQVASQLITDLIQADEIPTKSEAAADVTDEEVQSYYQDNIDQFKVPGGKTVPLSPRVESQIRNQLAVEDVQQATNDFEHSFTAKWRDRTLCADQYVTSDCSNGPEPSPATGPTGPGGALPIPTTPGVPPPPSSTTSAPSSTTSTP